MTDNNYKDKDSDNKKKNEAISLNGKIFLERSIKRKGE